MYLTELQLDALREMSNIGSGNAATAMAGMLGRPVDLDVPAARVLELADAVDAAGDPESEATAVVMPVAGELQATVVMLFSPPAAAGLAALLGVAGDAEMTLSALAEIGNILGSSYVGAIGSMCGIELEPAPPAALNDMLGAVVASTLAVTAADTDLALLLDSRMRIDQTECGFGFLFVPSRAGVELVLDRLGLGEAA